MPWNIGNTTIRNPYRIKDAVIALQGSNILSNLQGPEAEQRLALMLYDSGVVEPSDGTQEAIAQARLTVLPSEHSLPFLGRKWRAGLEKLGFLERVPGQAGAYALSPNALRLAEVAKTVQEQNGYLRAILALRPDAARAFSPLVLVVNVLLHLEREGQGAHITFDEMALFVQNTAANANAEETAKAICQHRAERASRAGELRPFLSALYARTAAQEDVKEATLMDYADMNLRYLKATGLFVSKGRGLAFDPNAKMIAVAIAALPVTQLTEESYLKLLHAGADLPTDDRHLSAAVISGMVAKLAEQGIARAMPDVGALDGKALEMLRLDLQDTLRQVDERAYAKAQAGLIPEIIGWLKAIQSPGGVETLPDGRELRVPRSERPAYLEWAIWRAFLAINSLANEPWDARRFRVDNEFLPVGPAPGGGPDMVFVFRKILLVVEVTLTGSSRQEAAEGEPVRRHVAGYESQAAGKRLYGLFLAPSIDSNTANTFRLGEWYKSDDSLFTVDIVPLTLDDFAMLLECGAKEPGRLHDSLNTLLLECRARANAPAPRWKTEIHTVVENSCRDMRGS